MLRFIDSNFVLFTTMLINVSFLPATLIHWFEKLIYQNRHYSYHPGKKTREHYDAFNDKCIFYDFY